MRGSWLVGVLAMGLTAISPHGEPPVEKPKPFAAQQTAEARKLPAELETLNIASRKMYAGARTLELFTIPVILASGDDLVLLKDGKRIAATVVPAEYHALKSVAHSTLALFSHLSFEPGRPLG